MVEGTAHSARCGEELHTLQCRIQSVIATCAAIVQAHTCLRPAHPCQVLHDILCWALYCHLRCRRSGTHLP